MSISGKSEKEAILNEEIEKYFVDFEKEIDSLNENYEAIRSESSSILNGFEISEIAYRVKALKDDVNYEATPEKALERIEEKVNELSGRFESIIEKARKAREILTAIKIDAGSIAAFKKALES